MKVKEEDRRAVVEYLRGSSKSRSAAAEALELDDDYVLDCIIEDQEIEECSACGWWVELHDTKEQDCEIVCNDCYTGEDDE